MPCNDYGSSGHSCDCSAEERRAAKAEAIACALARWMESASFDPAAVMDREAGVTPEQFRKWWTNHKLEDTRRRAREAEAIRVKRERAAGLAKLTPAERKALGIRE